ncbi:MAG: murein biosynthesis integral membrane protein MurJ [Candidatus Omnitrophica bacterium CG11_big_fil_rev_8_21_14_0_20_64_10]|nr:MAG: murein biosynthesis integral membrane protein MurJ [Candidatus Omnitrophica bacterium CG11_big_fil_rev_8_21_14_0_20_64_10]
MSDRKLLDHAGLLTAATGVSRVLGFLRDWLIAVVYGTTPAAQAFVVAYRIPNLLRTLIGEGAANAAFVPVLSRLRAREGAAAWSALAQAMAGRLLIGFVILCGLGVASAPLVVGLFAPGFKADPALFDLTVKLTRILFPFLGLVGIAAFGMGLLHSVRRFTAPALGPPLLNLSMMAGIFLWQPDAVGLSIGVLAGGLLQIAVQLPALTRAGVNLRPSLQGHPALREIGRLLFPRAAGSAVYQLSVLIDTIFASFAGWVGAGGVAALYFANRFLQLPLGLFSVSFSQAALPALSEQIALGDRAGARRTLGLTLRSTLFISVPSAVGLFLFAGPIVTTLLQHGAFSAEASAMTASAMRWYGIGLIGLAAGKVLTTGLYAAGESWGPVRSAGWALALNAALNLLLVRSMGLAGLALATSAAAVLNAYQLLRQIEKQLGPVEGIGWSWLLRLSAASLGMAAAAVGIWSARAVPAGGLSGWGAVGWLFGAILGSVAVFFVVAGLLRIEEADHFRGWIFRRR